MTDLSTTVMRRINAPLRIGASAKADRIKTAHLLAINSSACRAEHSASNTLGSGLLLSILCLGIVTKRYVLALW